MMAEEHILSPVIVWSYMWYQWLCYTHYSFEFKMNEWITNYVYVYWQIPECCIGASIVGSFLYACCLAPSVDRAWGSLLKRGSEKCWHLSSLYLSWVSEQTDRQLTFWNRERKGSLHNSIMRGVFGARHAYLHVKQYNTF